MRERTQIAIAAVIIIVVTNIAVALGQTVVEGIVLSVPVLVVVEYIKDKRR